MSEWITPDERNAMKTLFPGMEDEIIEALELLPGATAMERMENAKKVVKTFNKARRLVKATFFSPED